MSKIIYLKDGSFIKVSDYEKLTFDKDWVHVRGEYMVDRFRTEKSIPASNIKIIKEE